MLSCWLACVCVWVYVCVFYAWCWLNKNTKFISIHCFHIHSFENHVIKYKMNISRRCITVLFMTVWRLCSIFLFAHFAMVRDICVFEGEQTSIMFVVRFILWERYLLYTDWGSINSVDRMLANKIIVPYPHPPSISATRAQHCGQQWKFVKRNILIYSILCEISAVFSTASINRIKKENEMTGAGVVRLFVCIRKTSFILSKFSRCHNDDIFMWNKVHLPSLDFFCVLLFDQV